MTAAAVIPILDGWSGSANLHAYFVCDVFTARPLEGNQLAVFADGRPFDSTEMQRLARELNVSETVFLLPPENDGHVRARIFTPAAELPFAGHPVLGTAFIVGQALKLDKVVLETGSGPVPIQLERDGDRIVSGRMSQPIPAWDLFDRRDELLAALGVGSSVLPIELYRTGPGHVCVALDSEDAVAALRPDIGRLTELGAPVYCFAGKGARWKSRFFWPAGGVLEDPATGSAAGPLAIHLVRHGRVDSGEQIAIRQGEEIGRPSLLYAIAHGTSQQIESVEVGGEAVIVAEGRFRIAPDSARSRRWIGRSQ
jgi:trans-2,3-dihydro-3-hydroxyanthranilate isomerase